MARAGREDPDAADLLVDPDEAIERMLALIARRAGDTDDDDAGDFDEAETGEPEARQGQDEDRGVAELEGADVFAAIREEPGNVSVKTMERESAGCARLVAGDDSERQGWP